MIGFGTAGIRGPVDDTVTPAVALAVGRAVGTDVRARGGTESVVARDGRVTGRVLVAAFAAGLASAGVAVRRAGRLPTPALAYASLGRHGAAITASHNPPGDNGIKLFADGREYDREAEVRVEDRLAAEPAPAAWDGWGAITAIDVLDEYLDAVTGFVRDGDPVEGLSVAIDAGNGMAGVATPDLLRAIGADVTAINDNVDGHFPARESKPTAAAIGDLRALVAGGPFDLGIAHDGDADRVVVVDGDGGVVHEDTVVAILAEHAVAASESGDPVVVTTPNASSRIDERVTAAGGRVERVALGRLHEGVAAARDRGGDVVFAAEPWKHLHPGFGDWIDGVASAGVIATLVADAGGIDPLRAPVTERPARKTAVDCPEAAKPGAMRSLESALPARYDSAAVDTAYGVRLDFADGSWVLVRPSGTEPCLRIYAEGAGVDDLVDAVRAAVEAAVEAAR